MTQTEIMELIEEEDVEFIRLQFTDILGLLKNVAVTPAQMEKVLLNKYSFEGTAAFGSKYCFDDTLYLYPDIETFTILPWRPQQGKVAKVVCDVYYQDGTPFTLDSRYVLRQVLNKAKEKGYTFMVDPECEFFLFHTDENGLPTTNTHEKAGYMDVGPVDFGENARRDIVMMLEDMGFEIESSHHESAPAQHEIDFKEAEAGEMADRIQTFRFAVRSIAKRFGLHATFMPKPRGDMAGSGMHMNFKVFKDGKNLFADEDGRVNEKVLYFIGGILKHAKALVAIANPTVNSYKRLISGFEAPSKIAWSSKGEYAAVKLIKSMDAHKVELRFPDGSSNPYLLLAACIVAGLDGIENNIEAGDDIASDKSKLSAKESLPGNLRDALDALLSDELIVDALGKELVDIFVTIKENEWNDYMKEVSDWELDRYLTRV